MDKFTDYLKPVVPYISKDLISDRSFELIKKSTEIFPSDMAFTTFGFECVLNNEDPEADFLLSLISSKDGSKALSSLKLPDSLRENSVWKDLINFGKAWNDQNNFLYDRINFIWLEFDITKKSFFIPSIFFSPLDENKNSLEAKNLYMVIFENAFCILLEKSIYNNLKNKLIQCITKLPHTSVIFQIGIMKSRPTNYIRLCISIQNKGQVTKYLKSVGYPGNLEKLNKLLDWIQPYLDRICLDFDISKDVHPKIGLECYIESKSQMEKHFKLKNFLEELMKRDMCILKKKNALFLYPGYTSINQEENLWPNNLKKIHRLIKNSRSSFFIRSIHHIKIVFDGEALIEAKAYLAVNHLWK